MFVLMDSDSLIALAWGEVTFEPGPGQEVIETEQCLCYKCTWKWNPSTQEFENIGDCDFTPKQIVLQDQKTCEHYRIAFEDGILKTGFEEGSLSGMKLERFTQPVLGIDEEWEIEHNADPTFKRLIQLYNERLLTDKSLDFDAVDEDKFIQEDTTKTSFAEDNLHLQGYASGPYAHWCLNESSGAVAADASGYGRDGLLVNMEDTDWVPGKLNNCLQFDGANEYVNCGDIADFERDKAFSFEAWIKTSQTSMDIMTRYSGRGWIIYVASTGKIYVTLRNAAGTNEASKYSIGGINDGCWHHVIVTYDGSSSNSGIRIYIDGVNNTDEESGVDTLTDTIRVSTNMLIAGRTGSASFNGEIDECLIYDYKLTQADVTFRWNGGAGTEVSGYPVGQWYVLTGIAQINTSSWASLLSLLFTQETPSGTQLKYLVSVDGRTTWKKWDGDSWEVVTIGDIHTTGNIKAELEALGEDDWNLLFSPGTLDLAFGLKTTDEKETPSLDQIDLEISVPGKYKCRESELDIVLVGETVTKVVNISGAELNNLGAIVLT